MPCSPPLQHRPVTRRGLSAIPTGRLAQAASKAYCSDVVFPLNIGACSYDFLIILDVSSTTRGYRLGSDWLTLVPFP
jgi:hypothetical protein